MILLKPWKRLVQYVIEFFKGSHSFGYIKHDRNFTFNLDEAYKFDNKMQALGILRDPQYLGSIRDDFTYEVLPLSLAPTFLQQGLISDNS